MPTNATDPFATAPLSPDSRPDRVAIPRDWLELDVERALAEDLLEAPDFETRAFEAPAREAPAREVCDPETLGNDHGTALRPAGPDRRSRSDHSAALIPADTQLVADLWLREPARICGLPWFDAVCRRVDPALCVSWNVAEGDDVAEPTSIATLTGPARSMLTAERTALNFLQTLSGTASATARWVAALAGTGTRLLDTRKTLPGLRRAQKYATRVGGAANHRIGLWDAVLIKENHIAACGSIRAAIERARAQAHPAVRWIEVETETLAEVEQALAAGADVIMLDEFELPALAEAVARIRGRAISEASGGVSLATLADIAATGVDYISAGAITKHLHAIDFSLRFRS